MQGVPHLELWHGFLGTTILSILAAVKLYLNRKKPSAEIHETEAKTERTRAEARRMDVETAKAFNELVVAMSQQLREAAEQLRHRQQQEEIARRRAHLALSEIQRCIMRIRDYEERLRTEDLPVEPFEIRTYEQIMADVESEGRSE